MMDAKADHSMTWHLPDVEVSNVKLRFRIHDSELPLLNQLLSEFILDGQPQCRDLAKQWATCPTLWAWLIASHPTLKDRPVSQWLISSYRSFYETMETWTSNSQPENQWLTSHPGNRLIPDTTTATRVGLIDWIWSHSQPPEANVASAILLLSSARVPSIASPENEGRTFPPNWHGTQICQLVRDFRRGKETKTVVKIALMAQKAIASLPSSSLPSPDLAGLTNGVAQVFAKHARDHHRLEEEKLASLKQLAYGASHEVNNPLANISTRAQTLLQDETHPERRQKLAAIVAQAFRAHDMISNMMLFAHPPEIEMCRFELREWLSEQLPSLQAIGAAQGTRIEEEVAENEPSDLFVDGDPHQLGILLQSLVRNACEALGTGGTVSLTASADHSNSAMSSWTIKVADDGPGMSEENRRHCFDPFYSGREAGRGLGFGLSKAWTITKLHQGSIEVYPNEPQGMVFHVTLPNGMIESSAPDSRNGGSSTEELPCKNTPMAG